MENDPLFGELMPLVPHGPATFAKYQKFDKRHTKEFAARTTRQGADLRKKYLAAVERAKKRGLKTMPTGIPFKSNTTVPFFKGELQDRISSSPLHIDLGQILNILDYLEGLCAWLDSQVYEFLGLEQPSTDEPTKAEEKLTKQHLSLLDSVNSALTVFNLANQSWDEFINPQGRNQATLALVRQALLAIPAGDPRLDLLKPQGRQERTNGLALQQSRDAALAALNLELENLERVSAERQKLYSKRSKAAGPFGSLLQLVQDHENLQRQAYHSGALVGNDCAKMMLWRVRRALAFVFAQWEFTSLRGETKTFPSACGTQDAHCMQVVVATLLNKYALCRALHAPSRMLCRHEVELLRIRGVSFGNWAPTTLTSVWFHANWKTPPKFHIVVSGTAKFAARHFTVGLATEQAVEEVHARMNTYLSSFNSVRDAQQRMALCARTSWLEANPLLRMTQRMALFTESDY